MSNRPRFALTVRQPWAWLIMNAGKDVENRSWSPPAHQLRPGEWLAIHAGMTPVPRRDTWAWEVFGRYALPDTRLDLGAIVGCVRFVGTQDEHRPGRRLSRWAETGAVRWYFDRIAPLAHPIEIGGQQRLWRLPAGVASRLYGIYGTCLGEIPWEEGVAHA